MKVKIVVIFLGFCLFLLSGEVHACGSVVIDWGKDHQSRQGHWPSYKIHHHCSQKKKCQSREGRIYSGKKGFDIAVTALMMKSYLVRGYTASFGRFKMVVARAQKWLLKKQNLKKSHPFYGFFGARKKGEVTWSDLYNHACATAALLMHRNINIHKKKPGMRERLQGAIDFLFREIEKKCRNLLSNPRVRGIRLYTLGWTLAVAREVKVHHNLQRKYNLFQTTKIALPSQVFSRLLDWISHMAKALKISSLVRENTSYLTPVSADKRDLQIYAQALVVLGRIYGKNPLSREQSRKVMVFLLENLSYLERGGKGFNLHTWIFATEALFHMGGPAFDCGDKKVRLEELEKLDIYCCWFHCLQKEFYFSQRSRRDKNPCVYGSWDPRSDWGKIGGRAFTTSMSILTLDWIHRYQRLQRSQRR